MDTIGERPTEVSAIMGELEVIGAVYRLLEPARRSLGPPGLMALI
jgi:hypothetical protein